MFRKGQNNYTVTSCGDAKIYWVQLTSSSLRRLHIALRNLIYFCIKNKSIASTLCAQIFSTITLNHHWINAISSWQHKQLLRSYLATWPASKMVHNKVTRVLHVFRSNFWLAHGTMLKLGREVKDRRMGIIKLKKVVFVTFFFVFSSIFGFQSIRTHHLIEIKN